MNVDNQTILHIKEGTLPEKELVAHILSKKPNVFGFAVQEADGADMQTIREDASNLDEANLTEFLENSKARPRTLYFGNLKAGYNVDDIQPFVIKDPNDSTFMSIFLEGDVTTKAAEGRTEHAALVEGIIIPKIIEWCSDFDGDIDKVLAKLNGDNFNKDFLAHVGHRAVLHILPYKGDAVLLGPNQLGREFEWGYASQLIGYGEAAQEPAAAVAEKKKGYWKGGGKSAAVASQPTKVEEPKKVTPPPVPSSAATKGEGPRADTVIGTGVPIVCRPPAWLKKNEDIRDFYVVVSGKQHPGWKKGLPVTVTQNFDVLKCNNYDEYQAWRAENLKKTLQTKSETAPLVNNQPKQEKPPTKQERIAAQAQQQEKKEAPIQGPVDPTPMPILEPKELEQVLDFVAKHLDGNSKEIIPPQEMQKVEKVLPTFSETVGLSLPELMNWPASGVFALAAQYPKAIALAFIEARNYGRPYLQAELKAKAKDGVSTTVETAKSKTTTTVSNGATKVESVAKPEATAPVKKNAWGYGKKAA